MRNYKSTSLADQVFDKLENDIIQGIYQRGELLTELKLVEQLGVSRTPIREALSRLEQERLISTTGKGITVLGVTAKDLEDIFNIRIRIEGMVSAETAMRITDEQLAELRETLELQEFYVLKGDADRIKQMDSRFHRLIYRFSGSEVYNDALIPLHKKVKKYRKASVENSSRAELSAREHRAIFEAIEKRDPHLAEKYTVEHIVHARDYILNRGIE